MAETLSATRVGADAAARSLVMLHGIYGRGRNLRSVAQLVVAARPDYACWLVDLPYHGDSSAGQFGDTVSGLAQDVRTWIGRAAVESTAILGHSYGGKVALAIASQERDRALQIWVIDSTPEMKPPGGSAWAMLQIARDLPREVNTRDDAVAGLMDSGVERGVAQWMAQNLTLSNGRYRWKLDFDAMERLLRDFFATDLWDVVESPNHSHDIHFLKASESSTISDAAVSRLEAADANRVHVHHRTGGHWIHAESPQVVADLLIERLPR